MATRKRKPAPRSRSLPAGLTPGQQVKSMALGMLTDMAGRAAQGAAEVFFERLQEGITAANEMASQFAAGVAPKKHQTEDEEIIAEVID